MSGFSEQWLALREPADHAARDAGLTRKLVAWAAARCDRSPGPAQSAGVADAAVAVGASAGASAGAGAGAGAVSDTGASGSLAITDLGAGTGSNLRYLAPRLGLHQSWLLVDNDRQLLQGLAGRLHAWAAGRGDHLEQQGDTLVLSGSGPSGPYSARVTTRELDLATRLSPLPLDGTDLLTCAALLDLTSADWIDSLVERLAATPGCAALFVLNYDGRINWQPELVFDGSLTDLLNRHQRIDKGLGPALGPEAGKRVAHALRSAGYAMQWADSDWVIEPEHQALQEALLTGWVQAALEIAPGPPANGVRIGKPVEAEASLHQWHHQRRQLVHSRQSSLHVGHVDVLALPR